MYGRALSYQQNRLRQVDVSKPHRATIWRQNLDSWEANQSTILRSLISVNSGCSFRNLAASSEQDDLGRSGDIRLWKDLITSCKGGIHQKFLHTIFTPAPPLTAQKTLQFFESSVMGKPVQPMKCTLTRQEDREEHLMKSHDDIMMTSQSVTNPAIPWTDSSAPPPWHQRKFLKA